MIKKRDVCDHVSKATSKEVGRSTKIDDIPVPQFSLVRNTMANGLVDRSWIVLGVALTRGKEIAYVQTDFGNLR